MELFRFKKDIPFMSYGRVTTAISLVTFILAVFFLATKGLNLGVDFTGGTVMEVHYAHPADINKVRAELTEIGFHDALAQNFGSSHDVLIQVPVKANTTGSKLSEEVLAKLQSGDASVQMRRVEFRAASWPGAV
jgi:preprotein translocase subunit SecF